MMVESTIKLIIGLLLLVVCQARPKIDLKPEYQWETRQDWPECCQYSSVVRAFLCSACNPALSEIPENMPEDCVVVDLSFNDIPFVQNGRLNHLSSLQYLVLAYNRVSLFEPGAFAGLDVLDDLDLEFNMITQVPGDVPTSVRTLEMKGNPISYVNQTSLSYLTSLTSLTISTVELGSNTFTDLSLNSLEVFTCHIHRNAFTGLNPNFPLDLINPCPEYLSSDNTLLLEPFAFADMGGDSEAVTITIQNTSVPEIPYQAFYAMGSNVTSVELKDVDGLQAIHPGAFSDTPSLEKINITGQDGSNRLILYAGIISGFHPNLKEVDLSDLGVVDSIHAGIFDGLDGLTDLYLDGLELTYITPAVLLPLESQLEKLNVGNNPYRCDCNMRWLKELFDRASFNWFPETTLCASPPALAGMRFDELSADDFVC